MKHREAYDREKQSYPVYSSLERKTYNRKRHRITSGCYLISSVTFLSISSFICSLNGQSRSPGRQNKANNNDLKSLATQSATVANVVRPICDFTPKYYTVIKLSTQTEDRRRIHRDLLTNATNSWLYYKTRKTTITDFYTKCVF